GGQIISKREIVETFLTVYIQRFLEYQYLTVYCYCYFNKASIVGWGKMGHVFIPFSSHLIVNKEHSNNYKTVSSQLP
uniref:Uncharacterized protein n=1 Tax=Ciona intestinalis TaxID=7719 RepID=F6ZDQ0_CIOIN